MGIGIVKFDGNIYNFWKRFEEQCPRRFTKVQPYPPPRRGVLTIMLGAALECIKSWEVLIEYTTVHNCVDCQHSSTRSNSRTIVLCDCCSCDIVSIGMSPPLAKQSDMKLTITSTTCNSQGLQGEISTVCSEQRVLISHCNPWLAAANGCYL